MDPPNILPKGLSKPGDCDTSLPGVIVELLGFEILSICKIDNANSFQHLCGLYKYSRPIHLMKGFGVLFLRESKTKILLQVFKGLCIIRALIVVLGWSDRTSRKILWTLQLSNILCVRSRMTDSLHCLMAAS